MMQQFDLPDHVHAHRTFVKSWQRLPAHVQQSVRTTILRLRDTPFHPSLHTHVVKRVPGIQECYVSRGIRLLYRREQANLYLLDVGSHRCVERAHQSRSWPSPRLL